MEILIIANGVWEGSDDLLRSLARHVDLIIAANGGWHLARRAGIKVDLVIGDGDSLGPSERSALKRQGRWEEYPIEKDQTDFELALGRALSEKATRIICVALLGKRTDQTLGNLFLLEEAARAGVRVEIVEPEERIYLVRDELQLTDARIGDGVSLLALTDWVTGVETQGLKWPLRGEKLVRASSRGISNEVISLPVVINLFDGLLWVIHRPKTLASARASR
jgi:thiamine pyrophosphokinase